jgi:FkbM family methyltransferase
MKLLNSIIKSFIDLFSNILKKNKDALKYLFTVSLKEETAEFFETQYYRGYAHIDKAIKIIKKNLPKNHIVVDVGGADGVTPEIFAKHFPGTQIWIFEPLKENYEMIQSMSQKYSEFIVVPKAAGNQIGTAKINVASALSSSSIFELYADKNSDFFSDLLVTKRREEIEITKIDSTIPPNNYVSIMKLDVQGFELEVLKGAKNTLQRTSLIVLEVNNHEGYVGSPKYFELDSFLRENNFELFDIFPSLKDNDKLKEWDAIYVNKKLKL